MKTIFTSHSVIAAATALSLSACSTFGGSRLSSTSTPNNLHVERYVGSEAGFLVTSNLIVGRDDAVLVDAQFTRSDAKKVVAMIKDSGKNLKTVFVTHGHPDHYFGIETLRQEFPNARFVASQDTVLDIQASGQGKLDYWKKMYGAELPDAVPSVEVVTPEDLTLDGEQFKLKSLLPGESEHASVLVVESLKAAFVGDLAYDDVHLWLAEAIGHTDSWKANLAAIDRDPEVSKIFVGHQKTSRNNGKSLLKLNAQYIDTATKIFQESKTVNEASAKLKETYSTYALPVIADLAAAAFVK